MSGNRPILPPLESGTLRRPDGTIRRFNTRPANDRPANSASERLYTPTQQFHYDLDSLGSRIDRLTRHPSATVSGGQADTTRMASGSDRDLRHRFNRDPQPPNASLPGSTALPDSPSLPPLRSLGSRARAPLTTSGGPGPRSSRYRPVDVDRSSRSRSRTENARTEASRTEATPVQDWEIQLRLLQTQNLARVQPPPRDHDMAEERPEHSLEDWEAQLGFLQDQHARRRDAASSPMRAHDVAEESRPAKRRKVGSERIASSFKGFRYGKYGSVEPGQLTMEIVSCDGGLYSDEHSYPPENILKNDNSVYCTKSNRCNIVLKHQGGTVFSLKELVIKAPGSKFSCPIREGMVFIAMEQDDILARTAQYQIQYLASRSHRRGTVIFRHEEDGTGVTRIQSRPLRAYSYGADDDDDDDDDEDSRTAQIPPEFTAFSPPFNVITECSEDESDEDHVGRPRPPRRRTPNRIGALPFESDSDDDSVEISFTNNPHRRWPAGTEEDMRDTAVVARRSYRSYSNRAPASIIRTGGGSRGVGATSGMTLEEAQEASQIATQEAVRAVGGGLMAPLAHFFIEKDKNKCTIRFDPPVTGRFILLKMWSPHQDPQKNIDIQAVVAKGFAGPRFCPAVEPA